MKKRRVSKRLAWLLAVAVFVIGACGGGGVGGAGSGIEGLVDFMRVPLGDPLPGLSGADQGAFQEGKAAFGTAEDGEDGLGPVFNGTSCGECHSAGALGGAATNIGVARVTRIGGLRNGAYTDLAIVGGAVLQSRSLREFDPTYFCGGEVVPTQAKFVSHRITTPLFGAGLIEAIPDRNILANARKQVDGVQGTASYVKNIATGKVEVGRFGWKAQHSSLLVFSADAYLNEMGITSTLFPTENLPQGKAIPPEADEVADPEDKDGDVEKFTSFMRFLAPPSPRRGFDEQLRLGERVFAKTGCVVCHVSVLSTGPNFNPALANKSVRLYSDLLLHRMGSGLADGIVQGNAQGDQFRTAPLWGLSQRRLLLHDGRATTIEAAVAEHGGEATVAAGRFLTLSRKDREAVVAFLRNL